MPVVGLQLCYFVASGPAFILAGTPSLRAALQTAVVSDAAD